MGSADAGFSTLQLLARVLIYVAIVVFVVLSFLAYIETKWMQAEIKQEARELRRLKDEVRKEVKDVANRRGDRSEPDQ